MRGVYKIATESHPEFLTGQSLKSSLLRDFFLSDLRLVVHIGLLLQIQSL